MNKDRWILPIGLEGRIEISVSSQMMCSIRSHTTDAPESCLTLLTREELYDYIAELEKAQRRLNQLDQEARKKETSTAEDSKLHFTPEGWCCDPGNQARPRKGCECVCCTQSRGVLVED